jgi:Uma2 family endonuclease
MKVAEDIRYTVESYLKLEGSSELKHEFYHGKLFEMLGAPVLHNNICLKLFLVLITQLKQLGYQVNVENVKVKIQNEEIYLYPNILVTREQFQSMKDYVVHQPVLIAEVLSDSTRKYDSTDKFIQYQKISTLRYYSLVEPDDNGEWSSRPFTEMDEVLFLPVLQAQLTLADIYA